MNIYEKKYKDLIGAVKQLQKANPSDEGIRNWVNDNIPELAESEGERIRKEIMDFIDTKTIDSDERRNRWFSYLEKYKPISFTSLEDTKIKMSLMQYISELNQDVVHLHPGIETCNEWIAWLEKQGNTIPDECVFRPVAGCNIESAAKQAIKQQGVLAKKIVLAFNGAYIPVGGKAADIIVNEYNSWLEKQSEQKSYGQREECVDCQFNYAGECKGSCAMKRNEQKPTDKVESLDEFAGLTDFERTLADICIGWIGKEIGWKQYIKDNADALLQIAVEKFNSVQDVTFEQKAAWSEEDKIRLDRICKTLWKNRKGDTDEIYQQEQDIDFLKSIKDRVQPQNTWKPSEELIEALEDEVRNNKTVFRKKVLKELLEQLKKL